MKDITPALQYFTVIKKKYLPLRWLLVLASKPYLQVYNKWKQFSEKTEGLNILLFGHLVWCWSYLVKFEIHQTSDKKASKITIVLVFECSVWLVSLASPNILACTCVLLWCRFWSHASKMAVGSVCVCLCVMACLILVWPSHKTQGKFGHQKCLILVSRQTFYIWLEPKMRKWKAFLYVNLFLVITLVIPDYLRALHTGIISNSSLED